MMRGEAICHREIDKRKCMNCALRIRNVYTLPIHIRDRTLCIREENAACVTHCHLFHACGHERSFGENTGCSLLLHVRTHERAVGIIMIQERNHRSGNREGLVRSYVYEVDQVLRHGHRRALVPYLYNLWHDGVAFYRNGGMSNVVALFLKSIQV